MYAQNIDLFYDQLVEVALLQKGQMLVRRMFLTLIYKFIHTYLRYGCQGFAKGTFFKNMMSF